jgi:hypothetical protein
VSTVRVVLDPRRTTTWLELRRLAVYLRALRTFLREPLAEEEPLERVRVRLAGRDDAFLRILADGVFENPRSAYRALFSHAGIEHGDVVRLVRDEGLEGALGRLFAAGVRITVQELRGEQALVRGGVELDSEGKDFDSPLATAHYVGRTGGSRSAGTPVSVDLSRRTWHASYHALLLSAFGVGRPRSAVWFPAPPGVAGFGSVLSHAKLGHPVERWFSQTDWRRGSPKHAVFTAATLLASRLYGNPVPWPERTPPQAAARVARWLAEARVTGVPASLITSPSSAVRVCDAAQEHALDIAGSFFRLSGEPYSAARAAAVRAAGCIGAPSYYIAEAGGAVGIPCAAPLEPDEVHVAADRIAVLQRERTVADSTTVGELFLTVLDPLSPKVLINLESDDFGVLGERPCGCLLEEVGLSLHLHSIRARDKLTSEGMTFLGSDVITLLEQVLPSRFGGGATDYQLVEEEQNGVARVAIVVSPRVGELVEPEVVNHVVSYLRSRGRAQQLMVDVWEQTGTLRVERREPYGTLGAKTPSVHVIRP